MLNKKNNNYSKNETATIFWHHIHLLIIALNDYIDDIEESILNPELKLNNKHNLDKLNQYHNMTLEMISIINDEQKEYIKLHTLFDNKDFFNMFKKEMKNELVFKRIKEYLFVYKNLL